MGKRKFYYGDIGQVNERRPLHIGHKARVRKTVIRRYSYPSNRNAMSIRYHVDCECGKPLSLDSRSMSYASKWHILTNTVNFPTPREACYSKFFKETRIPGGVYDTDELNDRLATLSPLTVVGYVENILATLRPRLEECVRRYHGLNDEGKRESLQEIGNSLGVTRERVRQILTQAKILLGA